MKQLLLNLAFLSFFWLTAQNQGYNENVEDLYNKGYIHYGIQKDSGQFYFKKIENLALAQKDYPTALDILVTSNRHLGYFYELSEIEKVLKRIDSLIANTPSFWSYFDDELIYKNSILYDKGNYYYKLGDHLKAQTYFEEILNSYKIANISLQSPEHIDVYTGTLRFLAKIFQLSDKLGLAKDFYERSIALIKESALENNSSLYANYALLAEVLKEQGDLNSANTYLKITLAAAQKDRNNSNRIVSVSQSLAENYISLSKPDSTAFYISLMEKNIDRSSYLKYLVHLTKSKHYESLGEILKSLSEMDTSIESYTSPSNSVSSATLSYLYMEKASLLLLNGELDEALQYTDKGLKTLNTQFGKYYLELMDLKTNILAQKKDFHKANENALVAIASLDSLKAEYQYSNDKIKLTENLFPLFESAIESNFALYEQEQNESYLEQVFYFMEKSKSVLLMEALRTSRANKFTGVPDSLLAKERILQSEITSLEKEIIDQENPLNTKLFTLKQEQGALVNRLSENYPKYHNLRYGAKTVSTGETTDILKKDEILINYFYGNKAIYAITIGKDQKKMTKIDVNESLSSSLLNYSKQISNPKSSIQSIQKQGLEIYKKLVHPTLFGNAKRLIIIPDGNLNFIPFESLTDNSKKPHYLLENYSIYYVNSATLLSQLLKNKNRPNTLLAFAPTFKNQEITPSLTRDKLSPLPHNTTEVKTIGDFFDGKVLEGSNASLSNFLRHSKDYGIIHFATHAVFNNEETEYSYLAFSPTEENFLLYVKDLYNLDLNANMVALSACETGIGELHKGEGFLSLARGFFFSGTSSIASSLWKANDASTSKIMGDFYQNLSEGDFKGEALRKAKLSFLKNNSQNALSHPYYWSGFLISGNNSPINNSVPIWVWIFLGLVSVLVLLWFFRRRKTKPF